MGCGSSVKNGDKAVDHTVSNPPSVTEPWATKLQPPDSPIAGKASSSGAHTQDSTQLVDADDDEEPEIEILTDRKPYQMSDAANGQEPPQTYEVYRPQASSSQNPKKVVEGWGDPNGGKTFEEADSGPAPKPISKQQQEEAAKMAQLRKSFDQRRKEPQSANAKKFHTPVDAAPYQVLGLNQGGHGHHDRGAQALPPGQISDDVEDIPSAPTQVVKNHWGSSVLNDDDEEFMNHLVPLGDSQ